MYNNNNNVRIGRQLDISRDREGELGRMPAYILHILCKLFPRDVGREYR